MIWQTSRFQVDLAQPRVMGIVNVTPDSFSDGGAQASTAAALLRCEQLLRDGAHILDIGGESTRPGSPAVSVETELERLLPVVRAAVSLNVPVSVDTSKPEVMRAVLDLGVDIVNDVWALRRPGAHQAVAAHPGCGLCLMHMHREPQTMQATPMEGDVVAQVLSFWELHTHALLAAGVDFSRITVDPGIGFGKTVAQNFALLARQRELAAAGYPLVVGWSRKSSLGAVSGIASAGQRVIPSVAAAVLAVERGAHVIRVHDARETVAALAVWRAMKSAESGTSAGVLAP